MSIKTKIALQNNAILNGILIPKETTQISNAQSEKNQKFFITY